MKQFIATTFLYTLLGANAIHAHGTTRDQVTVCDTQNTHSISCTEHYSSLAVKHVKIPQPEHEIEYLAKGRTSVHQCKGAQYTALQVTQGLQKACTKLKKWKSNSGKKGFRRFGRQNKDKRYGGLRRLRRRARKQLKLKNKKNNFIFRLHTVPQADYKNGFTRISIVFNEHCDLIDVVAIKMRRRRIQLSFEEKYKPKYSRCKYMDN
ncbi:BgTH12-07159 [Blumeria graminis f. sp. triticale]|uniref:BgTH12-07159 n=1 Tax=Blumeria graminis f. sp. triticale TaxID=1689686 RepID=A0A9W4D9H1_BLUGR|nr:BgTH12-07159 [Blumeria graminis f. sp. triticale]